MFNKLSKQNRHTTYRNNIQINTDEKNIRMKKTSNVWHPLNVTDATRRQTRFS